MLLLLTLIMSAASLSSNTLSPVMLSNFDDDGQGQNWYTVHDTVMGGRSQGRFAIADGVLKFTGQLNTNGGGFASVRTKAAELNLDPFDTIVLRVRGDGRTYKMRLMTVNSQVTYTADFNTDPGAWCEISLPLASFIATWRGRQLARPVITHEDVVGMGLMIADRRDGLFMLEVDWIGVTTRE